MKTYLCVFVCSLAPLGLAQGTEIDSGLLGGGLIPDYGSTKFTWTYSGAPSFIAGLTVSLSISGVGASGAFNGDIFATLQHSSGVQTAVSVLLNRTGRLDAGSFGYDDNGMNVTFNDAIGAPDIHNYRLTLTGSHLTPLNRPVTGTWSTDGRAVDPAVVENSSDRTASLLDFVNLDPNGVWLLYLADMEVGGYARLDSWHLEIQTEPQPIPEPTRGGLLLALGLSGLGFLRRSRREG